MLDYSQSFCRYHLDWPGGASSRKSVVAVQKLASLQKLLSDLGDPTVSPRALIGKAAAGSRSHGLLKKVNEGKNVGVATVSSGFSPFILARRVEASLSDSQACACNTS